MFAGSFVYASLASKTGLHGVETHSNNFKGVMCKPNKPKIYLTELVS